MRRLALISCLVLSTLALSAPASGLAANPIQIKGVPFSQEFVFAAGDLCPFEVTGTLNGIFDVTLWTNDAGLVVREHDTGPTMTETLSGNGKAFSFSFSAFDRWTDYGTGAVLGSTASMKETGVLDKIPGLPATAGQLTFKGIVVDFLEIGGAEVPLTAHLFDFSFHGQTNPDDAFAAAVCAALS
jgi:hypothetical protein